MAGEKKALVEDFLREFRLLMNISGLTFVKRHELNEFTYEFGLTLENIKDIIKGLNYSNYVKGPEKDINFPEHQVFIFFDNVSSTQIYIKLSSDFSGPAKCISFHKAEYKMKKNQEIK